MTQSDNSISFYFFDFDDNIMFLETPILIRDRQTQEVKEISTTEFASIRNQLGQPGPWVNFEVFADTYKYSNDIPTEQLKSEETQYFVRDIERAISKPSMQWQAPSWPLFFHACQKQRPLAIITARGHSQETIKAGIDLLAEQQFIPKFPNYLAIYAVNNPQTKNELLSKLNLSERPKFEVIKDLTSVLKRIAINNIVDLALEKYGAEPPHRFGMSDDDPKNIDLIVKAMCDCKKKYLEKRFFALDTHKDEMVKLEVFPVDYPVTSKRTDRYIS